MQGRIPWGDLDLFVERGHRYANAPIAEALIEIQVQSDPALDLEQFRSLPLPGEWDVPSPGGSVQQAEIQFGGDGDVSKSTELLGYVLRRGDGARVVQARRDRMVYSWLPPYDRWEVFRDEARLAWLAYAQMVRPSAVSRLAVRFVNKIDIPRPSIELKDYVRTAVDLSPYLPQQIAGYFLQVEVPLDQHDARVRVISTISEPAAPGHTSLVLDIDAFRARTISLDADGAEDTIWSTLEVLRDAKNFVFESCITDGTRGLID